MKKVVKASLVAAILFGAATAPALADPPGGVVPLHQHYINTPHGPVAIASQFCDGEQSVAFDNLHFNVHLGAPGLQSGVVTISAAGC